MGKAVVMELVKEGAKVVIVARNVPKKTENNIFAVSADVSKLKDLEKAVSFTLKKFGKIDIIVNNAGGPPAGDFEKISDDLWQKTFETNFLSVVRASRLVLPHMKKSGGSIVNILSTSVKQPIDNLILSNAIRAGVAGLAKSMANEFAKYNIRVNNVCPGPFLTDRVKQLRLNKRAIDKIIEKVPLKRMGSPEELGALVAFLASEKASYITGTTIQIDGGLTKAIF